MQGRPAGRAAERQRGCTHTSAARPFEPTLPTLCRPSVRSIARGGPALNAPHRTEAGGASHAATSTAYVRCPQPRSSPDGLAPRAHAHPGPDALVGTLHRAAGPRPMKSPVLPISCPSLTWVTFVLRPQSVAPRGPLASCSGAPLRRVHDTSARTRDTLCAAPSQRALTIPVRIPAHHTGGPPSAGRAAGPRHYMRWRPPHLRTRAGPHHTHCAWLRRGPIPQFLDPHTPRTHTRTPSSARVPRRRTSRRVGEAFPGGSTLPDTTSMRRLGSVHTGALAIAIAIAPPPFWLHQ